MRGLALVLFGALETVSLRWIRNSVHSPDAVIDAA